MRAQFQEHRFRPESERLIAGCNEIIDGYLAQGLRLTLRQLYYQLVTRNVISNAERSYKNLSALVSDARLAGLMDWDAIEDRIRQPNIPPEFEDLPQLVRAALASYRLPRWAGQESYVELWVEKDALAGVLRPIAREYHVTLMVNRGYSSQSAMYESAQRFIENERDRAVLIYLGDHDPSGEDMVRDIGDRLEMFGVDGLEVEKLALTMDQVQEHNLPPNPAKERDPRAGAYIGKHGTHSWEVDALPPNVLAHLVREALDEVVDQDRMNQIKDQEQTDKAQLLEAVAELGS